jgi:hypothetical protein
MAMEGAGLLDVYDFLNETPGVKKSLTGLECADWHKSDLFKILFTPMPAGHASLPKGYREWLKTEGRELKSKLRDARTVFDSPSVSLSDDIQQLFVDVSDEEDHAQEALSLESFAGFRIETDAPLETGPHFHQCCSRPTDPRYWAGYALWAAGELADDRLENNLGRRSLPVRAIVDNIVKKTHCRRIDARRALSFVRSEATNTRKRTRDKRRILRVRGEQRN